MAREPRYRLDGPVGFIAAGILSTVLGILAVIMVFADDLAGTNTRGWFFALLGVPLGLVLTVVGFVRIRRGRRQGIRPPFESCQPLRTRRSRSKRAVGWSPRHQSCGVAASGDRRGRCSSWASSAARMCTQVLLRGSRHDDRAAPPLQRRRCRADDAPGEPHEDGRATNPGGAVMKVVVFVLTVLLTTIALVGSGVLLALMTPESDTLWVALAGAAIAIFLFGGMLLGSLRAHWDVDGSAESRSAYRRWLVGVLVGEALAAIALVGFTVATGAPAWIPVLYIGVGAALTALAPRIGAALRMHELAAPASAPAPAPGKVDDAVSVRRKVRSIVVTFAIALVIAALGLIAMDLAFDGALGVGMTILYALSLALLASTIAATLASLSLNRRLKAIAAGDLGRVRRLARAVLRGKAESFTDDEQAMALEYASVAPLALAFQGSSSTFLFAGLGLQQVASIVQRPDDALVPTILLVVLGAVWLVFVPLVVMQVRRGRRYRAEHDHGRVSASTAES